MPAKMMQDSCNNHIWVVIDTEVTFFCRACLGKASLSLCSAKEKGCIERWGIDFRERHKDCKKRLVTRLHDVTMCYLRALSEAAGMPKGWAKAKVLYRAHLLDEKMRFLSAIYETAKEPIM